MPTIQYGGNYLLTLFAKREGPQLTDYQRNMSWAGHAHAGVLVLQFLVAQVLIDNANAVPRLLWTACFGCPPAAVPGSASFFGAAGARHSTQPSALIGLLYAGVRVLAGSIPHAGIGPIWARLAKHA